MTPFEFMANAFYICAGAICLSIAALIVCGVSIGIYNAIKGNKRQQVNPDPAHLRTDKELAALEKRIAVKTGD